VAAKKIAASGQETAMGVTLFPPPALSGSGQAVGLALNPSQPGYSELPHHV